MASIPVLITAIGLLIILNSVFACMEIALVSVPRARLKRFQKEKRPGASTALELQRDIDFFFATVQVGVTFIATLSSAIGGSAAVEIFTPLMEMIGVRPESAAGHAIAILGVSVSIAYVNLIVGELVPKSVARRYPGRISLLLARPLAIFAKWLKPVVWFLTGSTRAVLRLLRIKLNHKAPALTAEELRMMATELVETRQMSVKIYDLLVRVTRLSQIRVEDVMIPRHKIVAVKAESKRDPILRDKLLKAFRKHHFTYYPVVDKRGENVLGVVNVKDLLYYDDHGRVSQLLRQPSFTARGQSLDRVLAQMQHSDEQLSVVVDEHGIIDGVITLEDILEELLGEMKGALSTLLEEPAKDSKTEVTVVDGLITLHELKEEHSISLPQSLYYSTLAGFVLDKLGRIPVAGDYVDYDTFRFEVAQMERNRIKELRIIPLNMVNGGKESEL
jgi:putative hemolysin